MDPSARMTSAGDPARSPGVRDITAGRRPPAAPASGYGRPRGAEDKIGPAADLSAHYDDNYTPIITSLALR